MKGVSIDTSLHFAQNERIFLLKKAKIFLKKVLTSREESAIISPVENKTLRRRQAVRQRTLTPSLPRFES